jgi:hypothetical protein
MINSAEISHMTDKRNMTADSTHSVFSKLWAVKEFYIYHKDYILDKNR